MEQDYYSVLGVKKNASQDEIKRAYRELAMKYHPDRNVDKSESEKKQIEERFKSVNEAYAVLSDPEKRQSYDAYGSEGFHQRFSEEDIFRGFNIDEVLRQMGFDINSFGGDMFSSMFGFGQGTRNVDMGSDLLTRVSVSLEEAAHGTEKTVLVHHIKVCERCGGSGAEKGSKIVKCDKCAGSGQVRVTRRTPFGIVQTISTCPSCNGEGKIAEKVCGKCHGRGRAEGQDKIEVKIPKGVDNGTRLRVRGMGDFGTGRAGDLYVDVSVSEHRLFKRRGDDLYIDLHVPFYTAALGGSMSVKTLDGEEKIRIEQGMQTGDTAVIKGKGMPRMGMTSTGNEVVRIIVDTPKQMTKEQKELIEKFKETEGGEKKKRFFSF